MRIKYEGTETEREHANSSAFLSTVCRSFDLSVRRHGGLVVGSDIVADHLICFSTKNEGNEGGLGDEHSVHQRYVDEAHTEPAAVGDNRSGGTFMGEEERYVRNIQGNATVVLHRCLHTVCI